MRIARYGALVGLLVVMAGAMIGCHGFLPSSPLGYSQPCADYTRSLPTDLPPNPDPTKKYCKVWVPPTYRKVPKLVRCEGGGMRNVTTTVMETTARDVLVRPGSGKCATTCPKTCEESLVQVKPGGYRWEDCGGCWQYKYRPPQYKWCRRTVTEEGVGYCVETPPVYKTVVETRPVRKTRQEYVPPKYKVVYVNEVFTPGRYEWQASGECECTPDHRNWSSRRLHSKTVTGCPPLKLPALDCSCPPTN